MARNKFLIVLCSFLIVILCLLLFRLDNFAASTAISQPHRCVENHYNGIDAVQVQNAFSVDESFRLPFQGEDKLSELQCAPWIKKLKDFIRDLQSPRDPVILVAIDDSHKPALINWLIAAQLKLKLPLENILIATYEEHFCSFFKTKGFKNCLSVPLSTLLRKTTIQTLSGMQTMTPVLVVRVSVMRILNRWGHDVMNIDSDAIVLRNPIPLFRQYPDVDIIGSLGAPMGALPQMSRQWGLVLCMGVILVRSSPSTGEVMHYVITTIFNPCPCGGGVIVCIMNYRIAGKFDGELNLAN